eukprot:scaffold59948_cov60-Phaeocystis_antarctica.AAC.8
MVPPWQCRGRPWQCCGRPCERAACALARRSGSRARLRARVDKYPTPARASDNLIVGGGERNIEQDRESGAAVRMFACRWIRVIVGRWVRGTRWCVLCSCHGVLCIATGAHIELRPPVRHRGEPDVVEQLGQEQQRHVRSTQR